MFRSDPIGLPGLAALALGFLCFAIAMLAARRRGSMTGREEGARRSRASTIGILVQGFGIFIAGFGPQYLALDPSSAAALGEGAGVALLMAAAVALFVWATRAMGRNWSIVARTRADHALVQEGPFARVRHPIYVAMALIMLALALATGHTRQLLIAAPVFALGTAIRVRIEEQLLRALFAGDYDAYASRVRRFVPGVF